MKDFLKQYGLLYLLALTQAVFLILKFVVVDLEDWSWYWVLSPSWILPVVLLTLYSVLIVWGTYQGLKKPD
ncbi:MAG: hypothetical protein ACK41O_18330 [Runella zeae]